MEINYKADWRVYWRPFLYFSRNHVKLVASVIEKEWGVKKKKKLKACFRLTNFEEKERSSYSFENNYYEIFLVFSHDQTILHDKLNTQCFIFFRFV